MTFICIFLPSQVSRPLEELAPAILKVAPRLRLDQEKRQIWADGKSLRVEKICADLQTVLEQKGVSIAQFGVSRTPIAAEVASRLSAPDNRIHQVNPSEESNFLATQPIAALLPSPPLENLFEGVGIETCGDLARLQQESVEVRFGGEGVHLWRLSRADDNRMIFSAMPRTLPQASLDWVDYTLSDPERLVFVINALVDSVSTSLESEGLCAREMTLVFSLANRSSYEHLVRPSRSTSSRKAWMRLIRTHLDTIVLADAVTGIALRVEAVTGEVERQGDIFDRGFATARATEETVAQLLDDQGAVIVVPANTQHPLLEKRTSWLTQEPAHAARTHMVRETGAEPRFTLQLLQTPRSILVKTARRRDHDLPVEYRDSEGWVTIESAAGPDRVSGGEWEEPYAREYFRCVTGEGTLVWIFRQA